MNLPWYHWGSDFGYGLMPGRASAVTALLDKGDGYGMDVVRWWLFPNASAAEASKVSVDIAAAEGIFRSLNLMWQPSLFSNSAGLLSADGSMSNAEIRALARTFDRSLVYSVDLVNEPEWEIWNGAVAEADVVKAVERWGDIFKAAGLRVTVNSAMADGWGIWGETGLSHLQASWYESYMRGGTWDIWANDADFYRDRFGLPDTLPLVVGEFYAGSPRRSGSDLAGLEARGYAGAFAWSANPAGTEDRMRINWKRLLNY